MKSSLKNMMLSLTGIALLAAAVLAIVNSLTEDAIADGAEQARQEAIRMILPPFDKLEQATATDVDGDSLTVYQASKDNVAVGTAVETFSDNGFGGRITIVVGFTGDGTLYGYRVLEHAETPGLGANMSTWFSQAGTSHDVTGSKSDLSVAADGGTVDAMTGATITSRAFLEAINRARSALK